MRVLPEDYERSKTRFLELLRHDNPAALEIAPLVYEELYRLARSRRRPQSLSASDLVHEAYMRLFRRNGREWSDRGHFFAMAARAMHCILVDHARSNGRLARADSPSELADGVELRIGEIPVQITAIDDALKKLEAKDPVLVKAVTLRFYTRFTLAEIAAAVDIPYRTFERRWKMLEAWLWKELELGLGDDGAGGARG